MSFEIPPLRQLTIGSLTRGELHVALEARGVRLNEHALALLASDAFENQIERDVAVAVRSVAQLGLDDGVSLSEILKSVKGGGFELCPAYAGPYVRLALAEQASSSDHELSVGSAPDGSITVASSPVSPDDEFPKGFYLRAVDGDLWLRGYRCDDEHGWSANDLFLVMLPSS